MGVFEVQAWVGSYANYAIAVASDPGQHYGQSTEFLNGTGDPSIPGMPPVNTTGWDGNLILGPTPEPGTMALATLGATVLFYFRRPKQM